MSVATEISRLQTAKSDIKTAIEAKGVTVPSSAKIDVYDDYISQISTGKEKKYDDVTPGLYFYMVDGTLMTGSEYQASTAYDSATKSYPNYKGHPVGIAVITSDCKFVIRKNFEDTAPLFRGDMVYVKDAERTGLLLYSNRNSAINSSNDFNGYKQSVGLYQNAPADKTTGNLGNALEKSFNYGHLPTVSQARLIQSNWDAINSMITTYLSYQDFTQLSASDTYWTSTVYIDRDYSEQYGYCYIGVCYFRKTVIATGGPYEYSFKAIPILTLDYDYENMQSL